MSEMEPTAEKPSVEPTPGEGSETYADKVARMSPDDRARTVQDLLVRHAQAAEQIAYDNPGTQVEAVARTNAERSQAGHAAIEDKIGTTDAAEDITDPATGEEKSAE